MNKEMACHLLQRIGIGPFDPMCANSARSGQKSPGGQTQGYRNCQTASHSYQYRQGYKLPWNERSAAPPNPPKVTGELEAKIIVLCCSEPPAGRSRKSLRLLADRAIELQYIDSLSYDTVDRILKKANLSLISRNVGASRPSKPRYS